MPLIREDNTGAYTVASTSTAVWDRLVEYATVAMQALGHDSAVVSLISECERRRDTDLVLIVRGVTNGQHGDD